jgi:hypothetical protein
MMLVVATTESLPLTCWGSTLQDETSISPTSSIISTMFFFFMIFLSN